MFRRLVAFSAGLMMEREFILRLNKKNFPSSIGGVMGNGHSNTNITFLCSSGF